MQVVKQLDLTVSYQTKVGLRTKDLYGQNPIKVDFINDNDRQSFSFDVTLLPDSQILLNRFEQAGEKIKQEIKGLFEENERILTTGFSEAELNQLRDYLKRMIDNMKN